MATTPAPPTEKKNVNLETSTRYIRRFGGYHEKYWVDFDKHHVLAKFRLLDTTANRVAEVEIPNTKPLPKSTLAGFLIGIALKGKASLSDFSISFLVSRKVFFFLFFDTNSPVFLRFLFDFWAKIRYNYSIRKARVNRQVKPPPSAKP